MKAIVPRLLIVTVTLAVLAAGYILFHPGISFAETTIAKNPAVENFPQSGHFTVDPAHTCLGFDIGHLGLSRVQGRFSHPVGTLFVDKKNIANSNVEITVETATIDTAVAPRDADLRSNHFFDVEKYPKLTFTSTSIKKKSKSTFLALGDLTIKGISKPITIRFKVYGPIKDPWGNARIGVVAEPLTIHRSDFGITYDADTVSDDVKIRLSLEATLDK